MRISRGSQRLRHRKSKNSIPRKHNSMHMAIHAPCSPQRGTMRSVSVTRTPHMLVKFSTELSSELPAP